MVLVVSVCRIVEHDTPWLLRAGEEILRTRSLPRLDPFSYTSQQEWLNHEWLAEVLLAATHRLGGLLGLGLLQGIVCAATVGLLVWARPRGDENRDPLAGFAPVAFAAAAAILREAASPRAQLFANLLFAATLAVALRSARARQGGGSARMAAALAIGLALTQVHGGNPNVAILFGLLFLSAPSLRNALMALAAAALTCAGPYGYHVHEHFLRGQDTLPVFHEWRPLSFAVSEGSPILIGFLVLDLAAFGALLHRHRRGENIRFEALALLFFSAAAARYVRFSSEASMVAAVVLAPALARIRPGRAGILGLAAALALLVAVLPLSARGIGIGFEADRFPIAAVEFLRAQHPPGPMFNSYGYGGYLMWAWPEERVFIDGRAFTVYPADRIGDLLAVYDDPPRFRELERRFGFRLAVLQRSGRGAALVEELRKRADWRIVHEDAVATVLVRDAGPADPPAR